MNSSSRNGAKVIWLCLHTTEGIMRAWDLRNWTSWAGSSHAANDETGVLLTPEHGFVPYDRAAWTLRNGNPISENIEQCGWARWTRAEWLARPKLLDTTARWLADRSRARGIPLRRLSHAEVRARVPGVIMHDDYSKATGDGEHWDCGPGYPWDVVLTKASAYAAGTPIEEDFMATMSDQEKAALMEVVYTFLPGKSGRTAGAGWVRLDDARNGVVRIEAIVRAAAAGAGLSQAQIDQIIAGVARELGEGFDVELQPKTDPAA